MDLAKSNPVTPLHVSVAVKSTLSFYYRSLLSTTNFINVRCVILHSIKEGHNKKGPVTNGLTTTAIQTVVVNEISVGSKPSLASTAIDANNVYRQRVFEFSLNVSYVLFSLSRGGVLPTAPELFLKTHFKTVAGKGEIAANKKAKQISVHTFKHIFKAL